MSQCKRIKANGEQCRNNAVTGRETCHKHGGATPRGAASPHFKTGEYSKDLPTRYIAKAMKRLTDGDVLQMQQPIAVLTERFYELVDGLDVAPSLWFELEKLLDDFEDARMRLRSLPENSVRARELAAYSADLLQRVIFTVRKGAGFGHQWQDACDAIEQARKLVETETKRQQREHEMISLDKFELAMRAIMGSVGRHVHDPQTLAAIAEDVNRYAHDVL